MTEGREMERDLQSRMGEKLRGKLVFRDETLAQRGDEISQETLVALKEAVSSAMAALEQTIADKKADVQLMANRLARLKAEEVKSR